MKSYLRNLRKYVIPTILSLSLWLGGAAPRAGPVEVDFWNEGRGSAIDLV